MGQESSHTPQPGDLIEIFRPVYQHWALYVGDGYVIHVTDEGAQSVLGSSSSMSTTKAKVKKELLKKVVKNDKWRVNNKYDDSRTPRPVREIIRRAERWVDMEVSYNVITNNCEHFVTMLRYGEGRSEQVTKAAIGTTAAVGGMLLIGGLVAAVVNGCSGDSSSKEKKNYCKSTDQDIGIPWPQL